MLNELSLFSGYGGFSLGLRLAGIVTRTVMYVEWERYPQEVIKARIKDGYLDDAPIWGDISTLDGWQLRGVVDLITGGFPCQPHSVAGLKRGADDARNLWPETLRVIREVGPRYVLLENVPGILSASADGGTPAYGGTVVGELASIGYSVHWQTIGADDVGAPHRRKRWWCIGVADSDCVGSTSDTRDYGEERSLPEAQRQPEHGPPIPGRGGPELGDSDGNGTEWDQSQHWARGRAELGGEELGNAPGAGSQGRQQPVRGSANELPTWPPSPSDAAEWERVLRERPDLAPAVEYTKGRPQLQAGESSPIRGSRPRQDSGRGHRGVDWTEANDSALESQVRGVAHGRSHRVGELKALGNGIVPAVVAEFLRTVIEVEKT